MDRECAEVLAALKAAYPRQQITEETLELYTACLADLPAGAVRAAVTRHILTSPWFPTVADLRRLITEAVRRLPTAEEAWLEVQQVAAHPPSRRVVALWRDLDGQERRQEVEVSDSGEPQFSCPELQAAVAAVGWDDIRFNDLSDAPGVLRGQFMRIYAAVRVRAMAEAQAGDWAGVGAPRGRSQVEQVGAILARLLPAPAGGSAEEQNRLAQGGVGRGQADTG